MESKRHQQRVVVDIAVTLTTVLDSQDARIIDLSQHGAQIVDASMPAGAKFQIEYMGQTVYAHCMWSEVDRMGVRFPFDLSDGPLYDRLMMAAPTARLSSSSTPQPGMKASFTAPFSDFSAMPSRRAASPGFGRRNSA
ncbi:MAG TPA: PilZ domain-containing protein [Sphingobium sp.]